MRCVIPGCENEIPIDRDKSEGKLCDAHLKPITEKLDRLIGVFEEAWQRERQQRYEGRRS